MNIRDFATMTYTVLEETPLSEYIPTLCLPQSRQLMVLQGIPQDKQADLKAVSLKWAEETAQNGEDFLVCFPDGEGYFRIIRRSDGQLQEALFPEQKPANWSSIS